MPKKIFVTQPNLPEIEELIPLLRDIWESKVLTNGGPYHQKLEKELWGIFDRLSYLRM